MKFFSLCCMLMFAVYCRAGAEDNPRYEITVYLEDAELGSIEIELFPDVAPLHVRNFDSLVSIRFYDFTAFHRVIPGFMIQGGDPNSRDKPRSTWGTGDPSQRRIPAEFNNLLHERGTLAAARTPDPNSATSQFYICVSEQPHLDGKYTIYGEVLEGMDVVDVIVAQPRDIFDNPLEKVEMVIRKLASPTSVGDDEKETRTLRAVPNPIVNGSAIHFTVASAANVRLEVFNHLGQHVAEPTNSFYAPGHHSAILNAMDLAAGVYYCRLSLDGVHAETLPLLVQ